MATTRKSAKRSAGKKSGGRGASARKKTTRKSASRRPASSRRSAAKPKKAAGRKKSSSTLSKRAAEGLRAARGGVETVKQAGDKLWESLRSTTSQVVENVRDRLGEDGSRSTPSDR